MTWSLLHDCLVIVVLISHLSAAISTTWASERFIGYYVAPDSIEPLLAGNSWTTSGSYAGDCNGGNCVIATNCANGTLFYNNQATKDCSAPFSCAQMTIFATSPNILPSAYNFGCRNGWKANTVYRELAATTTSSSSMASTTTTPAPSTPTPTSSVATSTPSAEKTVASRGNNGWIAGVVLGPLLAIALVVLAWILWRQRRTKLVHGQVEYGPAVIHPEYAPGEQHVWEKHTVTPLSELLSAQERVELYQPPSELSAGR